MLTSANAGSAPLPRAIVLPGFESLAENGMRTLSTPPNSLRMSDTLALHYHRKCPTGKFSRRRSRSAILLPTRTRNFPETLKSKPQLPRGFKACRFFREHAHPNPARHSQCMNTFSFIQAPPAPPSTLGALRSALPAIFGNSDIWNCRPLC